MENKKITKLIENRKKKLSDIEIIKKKYPHDNSVQTVADSQILDLKFVISALAEISDELCNCNKPHVSNSFCECKNLNYGYTIPVCYNCRKAVDILAK